VKTRPNFVREAESKERSKNECYLPLKYKYFLGNASVGHRMAKTHVARLSVLRQAAEKDVHKTFSSRRQSRVLMTMMMMLIYLKIVPTFFNVTLNNIIHLQNESD
jgi:hypothetical protein